MELLLRRNPEDLGYLFDTLVEPQDVASLLEVDYRELAFYLYAAEPHQRYTTFLIPKRAGGSREICAPRARLKAIQWRLYQVLKEVYEEKPPVYGFVKGRSIVDNAAVHAGKRYVLNIDLQNFFPSINFGRVLGLFSNYPYERPKKVATILAQICCFENSLPQGAPTSPIVSNMICAQMDDWLYRLARSRRCDYKRYADDLAFSTREEKFPYDLAFKDETGTVKVGVALENTIARSGFSINPRKVRLQTQDERQEVTGLVTNVSPNVARNYVRQIRAMLHNWEKDGLVQTQREFELHYDWNHRHPLKGCPDFRYVVQGKIEFVGMVRGKDDPTYKRLVQQLHTLAPELTRVNASEYTSADVKPIALPIPFIWTEGKSDRKHLDAALRWFHEQGRLIDVEIRFPKDAPEGKHGDVALLDQLRELATLPTSFPQPYIFIFDRDNEKIVPQVRGEETEYRAWGNNLYSFPIPVPIHRIDTPEVCIELYYTDHDLRTSDQDGRRLFLNNEFYSKGGHKEVAGIHCLDLHRINRHDLTIIDSNVWQGDLSIALAKDDFATNIYRRFEGFSQVDFAEFERIFQLIREILRLCT